MHIRGLSETGGLSKRQKKRRQRNERIAKAKAKDDAGVRLTSTPVMATGKRDRTGDNSSVLPLSSEVKEGTEQSARKGPKAKKRRVAVPESETPKGPTGSTEQEPQSADALPSTSGCSFARMAARALTVEIKTDKGNGLLSKGQLDYFDSRIWKAIGESADKPKFEGMRVEDGTVKVQCSDLKAREWLDRVVAEIPACERAKFTVVDGSKIRLVRASAWIPGPTRKSSEVLERIHAQNDGLDTSKWRTYSYIREKSRSTKEMGTHLVVGIDPDSLKVLKSRYGCRPHLHLGRIQFRFQDKAEDKA